LRFHASTFNAKTEIIYGDVIGGGFIFRKKMRPTLQSKFANTGTGTRSAA
jgi:hypothetical protein